MKTKWSYLWEDTLATDPLNRTRVAYLLRAARSRQANNVGRFEYGYRIADSGMRLVREK